MARLVQPMVRSGQYGRIALMAPAKAGKTWTALEWAQALEKIEVEAGHPGGILGIDTERGEMKLYADKFVQVDGEPVQHMQWDPPYDPLELRAEVDVWSEKVAVIVVDSGSHFWRGEGGVLDIVDSAGGKSQFTSGWKEGTPAQNELVDAITRARCHVIFTMRSKMAYVLETNDRGKQEPRRVGLAPVQRDDMEYEFTVIASIDMDHNVEVVGSRCDLLDGRRFKKGKTVELAEILGEWLQGAEALITRDELDQITKAVRSLEPGWMDACRAEFRDKFGPSDRLRSADVAGALAFIADWLPGDDDLGDDPDEIAREAVSKAKTTKKGSAPRGAAKKAKKATKKPARAKKPSGAPRDGPIPATGEPWDDPAVDTPSEAGTAEDGSEALSQGDRIRGQLVNVLLQLSGPYGLEVESALSDVGLWPIEDVPDDRAVEASDVVAPIAERFAEETSE